MQKKLFPRVLIACEYSGVVRDAFIKRGIDATSCDILPTESDGPHIQGDVLEVLIDGWDMMIAHPPCTYLANSGVQGLHKDLNRWFKLHEGALFFKKLLEADIPYKAIENPVMHKYAKAIVGRSQDQSFQPYHFGHKETKRTCLWLSGLPKLKHTSDLKEETYALPDKERQRLHWLSNTPERAKLRSMTFQGVADAMAEQWGDYLLEQWAEAK